MNAYGQVHGLARLSVQTPEGGLCAARQLLLHTASHFLQSVARFLHFQVEVISSVFSNIRLCGLNPKEQRKDSSNSRKTGLPPATPRQKFGSGLLEGAPRPHAAKSRRYALSGESSRRGAESPKPTVKSKPG